MVRVDLIEKATLNKDLKEEKDFALSRVSELCRRGESKCKGPGGKSLTSLWEERE